MKTLRAIICDDEEKARRLLKHLLEASRFEVEIVAETANLPDAVIALNTTEADVLFLDIEMPKYNGLQILEFYKEKELPCALVFVTAYNEFAMQAFRLSALDYLLKPATLELVEEVLEKVSEHEVSQQRERVENLKGHYEHSFNRIALPNSSGFQFVDMNSILYLEADGMYSKLYLIEGNPILVSKPLVDFEKLLQNNPIFFKVHRKYIINLNHMKRFTKSTYEIEMTNGNSLPLSRHRKQDFEEEIHSQIPGRQ